VPKEYLAQYGIETEAVLVGLLDHIAVWHPADFDRRLAGAEEVVRRMEHLL